MNSFETFISVQLIIRVIGFVLIKFIVSMSLGIPYLFNC